jgi:hypothetical protein
MINLFKLAAMAKAAAKNKPEPALASSDKLAQEQMSRRAALRRIGMTGAMTVIGLMSIDDLARVSVKKLGEHEMTRGIAADFKAAGIGFQGVAFADGYMPPTIDENVRLKPPSDKAIFDANLKCAAKGGGINAYWVCMGNALGTATFDQNYQYIWCKMQDPGGNNGACPGFPATVPCAVTNPVQKVAQSCCEAKAAKCVVKTGGAGAGGCQNELTICEAKADMQPDA